MIQLLVLTETWLPRFGTAAAAATFAFGGVSISHGPRPEGRGGGVGLLLSQCCQHHTLPTSPSLCFSIFKIHFAPLYSTLHLWVAILYHPPGTLSFISDLGYWLTFISDNLPTLFLGDFNVHMTWTTTLTWLRADCSPLPSPWYSPLDWLPYWLLWPFSWLGLYQNLFGLSLNSLFWNSHSLITTSSLWTSPTAPLSPLTSFFHFPWLAGYG